MKKFLFMIVLTLFILPNAFAGFQIKTAPISLLAGLTNAEIGFGMGNFVIGVGGMSGSYSNGIDTIKASESHVRLDYMFNGAFTQGWYLSASYAKISIELTQSPIFGGDDLTGSADASGFIVGVGYRWQWTSFFMELGLQYASLKFDDDKITISDGTTTEEEDAPSSVTGSGLEYNIGWSF